MKILGKTDIGRSRRENQDTFRSGQIPGVGAFGVVCDGMGGAKNGRLASSVAADCIEEMLFQRLGAAEGDTNPGRDTVSGRGTAFGRDTAGGAVSGSGPVPGDPCNFRGIMEDAIFLANGEVFARGGGGDDMMGTTAVCAIISKGVIHYAHVGDSRLYIYENGRLRRKTRDHSMVQQLLDTGAITGAEAARHPERNVITRALGAEKTVEPAFGQCPITAGGIALLCTDGLTNMVDAARLLAILEGGDIYDMPASLVDAALLAGGEDNITVLLMQPGAGD